jgi:uncharacterized protein (TIGR02646 family)
MIKVKRTGGLPPEVAKLAEAEEKRNFNKQKKIFSVYSDARVKATLEKIFHGKCAYCESRYRATQPMDVEHWRPKSVYWFLAADWVNLYPSCIDCNRRRKHTVRMEDGSERTLLLGKLDDFPLVNGTAAAGDRAGVKSERPLLLDPCEDDPESFFEYTKEGVIRSKKADQRAETSITVYALNRMGLVIERYERQLLVGKHIHRIRQLARGLEWLADRKPKRAGDKELAAIIEDLIRYEVSALRSLCEGAQPYAAQSRQLVKEFFDSVDGLPQWLSSR